MACQPADTRCIDNIILLCTFLFFQHIPSDQRPHMTEYVANNITRIYAVVPRILDGDNFVPPAHGTVVPLLALDIMPL